MRDRRWKIFVEVHDEWVPVGELEDGSRYQAVKRYREEHTKLLYIISNGHGDAVNIEAEEIL